MNLSKIGFVAMGLAATVLPISSSAEILVKTGEKIGFLGDSITQAGWENSRGYVKLVISGLAANGVTVEPAPAGISGHKSNQMLARLESDVLSKKPQWMTLSCGVNDVWHGANGVPIEAYKENITKLVAQATAASVKVVILTATVIHEDPASPENLRLAPYNDFLRSLAAEKGLKLADVNALFQQEIKSLNKPDQKVLTSDGVHMNAEGNKLMAVGVLKAFGLGEDEMKKAQAAWAGAAK